MNSISIMLLNLSFLTRMIRVFISNGFEDSFDRTDHLVENLVHQFGLLFFRNIHYRFESAAGEPAGFGVGRPAAWQDKHTGVGP